MSHRSLSIFLFVGIILLDGCVERLGLTQEESSRLPIVINGFISDQPGPYTIKIKQSFEVGSRNSLERPISVKQLTISDNQGNQEVLSEVSQGTYQTSVSGIRGVVGNAYKLTVVTFNGKTYESTPDTLKSPGRLDSVYYKFRSFTELNLSKKYFFDIYFNAGGNENESSSYFVWKFKGTFKVITDPLSDREEEPCGDIDCAGCSICNRVQKCTGIRNFGTPKEPLFRRIGPCECCTCWYSIYNDSPILSDYQYLQSGSFEGIRAGIIPIDDWVLQHKIYAEVSQFSISRQTYLFYKAVKDQQLGAASLFQPPSGKIPGNFNQLTGTPEKALGLFYAASVSSKHVVLTQREVPQFTYEFPKFDARPPKNCLKLYPNSTNVKPDFWTD